MRQSPQQLSVLNKLANNFTIKLQDVKEHRWWTLITPSFSHIQFGHIIGNLFAFHTFSSMAIQGGLRARSYGVLILGSSIVSHLAFLTQDYRRLKDQLSQRDGPGGNKIQPLQHTRALGLSGVVMGLGAAVSLAMPRAKVLLFGVVPTPMWALMILYVGYDSARLDDRTSTTGHAAHLGGAVFGALFDLLRLRSGLR